MTNNATHWVWEHSRSIGPQRLLLLALAARADNTGRGRLPAKTELVRMCRFAQPNPVLGLLFELMDLGELDIGELPEDEPGDPPMFTINQNREQGATMGDTAPGMLVPAGPLLQLADDWGLWLRVAKRVQPVRGEVDNLIHGRSVAMVACLLGELRKVLEESMSSGEDPEGEGS